MSTLTSRIFRKDLENDSHFRLTGKVIFKYGNKFKSRKVQWRDDSGAYVRVNNEYCDLYPSNHPDFFLLYPMELEETS